MKRKLMRIALFSVKSPTPITLKGNRVPLGVWMVLLPAVLSLAGCSRNLADLFGLGIDEEVPPEVEIGGSVTVTYGKGNGGGGSTEFPQPADGGKIKLPDSGSFTPPATGFEMAFAGWHDGTLTYEAGYEYTVTGNVTLEARWGFTTKEGVAWYLGTSNAHFKDKDGNILLVVCGGSLAWTDLSDMTNVELDLSASTLGVASGVFDLKNVKTSAVLILPRAVMSAKDNYTNNKGTAALHEVSGLYVTTIKDNAFKDCTSLKKADFPAAKTIGSHAFEGCTSLATVDLPAAERKIGTYAFKGCTSLATVDFSKATSIGSEAFKGCTSLATADFSKTTSIDSDAFLNCPLETIAVGVLKKIDTSIHDSFADVYTVAGTYKFDKGEWVLFEAAAKTEEPAD